MAKALKNTKVFIATIGTTPGPADPTTPEAQNMDLTQTQFEDLTWTPISNVGQIGQLGSDTNLITYDELTTIVTQKAKGVTDAGSPTFECARNSADDGQTAMTKAGNPEDSQEYALKIEMNDGTATTTPTIYYDRGVVTGPTRPGGGVEDFDLIVFTMGCNQAEVVVLPATI